MDYTVDEKRIKNFLIEIFPDDNPDDPREWDNLGKMICFHGRYSLGDDHDYDSEVCTSWDEMEYDIIKREKAVSIFPLFLYDHSGITMNTSGFSCPWDSGQVGFIVAPRETVLREMGWKRITKQRREQIEKILLAEVKTYDQYLTGDVYGFVVSKVDEEDNKEHYDSCWGFYGEEYCMEEAESIVEYAIEHNR